MICVLAVIVIVASITVYANLRTHYQSNILNQTIELPNGAYFIHEKDFGDSCEIYFSMFGDESNIVSGIESLETGFNLPSSNLYRFQEWIVNNNGLYKKITLVYYKSKNEVN